MRMKFEVNKALVPMKGHYFLWNAATGPVTPYLSTYARQLGFNSAVVGQIYTILPVSGMIAKPLFGAIADRFHLQKLIFLFTQLLTAAAFLSIFYSPKLPSYVSADFSCTGSQVVFSNPSDLSIRSTFLEIIQAKNEVTQCQFLCPMSNESLNVLCSDWPLCLNESPVNFTALVLLNQTTHQGGLANFVVDQIKIGETQFTPQCTSGRVTSTCTLDCDDQDVNLLLKDNRVSTEEAYTTYQFWVFLVLMIVGWVGQAVNTSIADAICFELLGDRSNRYGHQRCWGALGWGLFTLLSGVLVDVASVGKPYMDYAICFYLSAAFFILDFGVSTTLKYNQVKVSTNIVKDVGKLLANVRILIFLGWCVVVGMCTGLMWNFFLWMVEDLGEARNDARIQSLKGILMGVQCLGGELPFFFLSGKILKVMGHVHAMTMVLFTLGVRFLLYSVIDDPWWFIPIEFSNGLTYGVCYACMASYASIIAPLGTEATMQGMVGAIFEGVGVSLGSLLGGQAMNRVSGQVTFRYFGIAALCAGVLHVIVQYLLGSADPQSSVVVVGEKKHTLKTILDDKQQATLLPLIAR